MRRSCHSVCFQSCFCQGAIMRFGAGSADQLVFRLFKRRCCWAMHQLGVGCSRLLNRPVLMTCYICVRRLMLTYKMLSVFILLYKHAEAETNGINRSSSVVMESVVSLSPLIYNYIPRGVWVASSCMSKAMQRAHLLTTVAWCRNINLAPLTWT